MTIEQLHDALNLLPTDLITAADTLRSRKTKPVINYARWFSLAACLAILIGSGFIFRNYILPGLGGVKEMALEAPAAAAPAESPAAAPILPEVSGEWDEVPAMEAAPSDNKAAGSTTNSNIHPHSFAADADLQESEAGYRGPTQVTVSAGGMTYTLSDDQAMAVTDILATLPYDPAQTCRCMAEFRVDTALLTSIDVNLTESFARCELGQAALTESQTKTLRKIFESLVEQ